MAAMCDIAQTGEGRDLILGTEAAGYLERLGVTRDPSEHTLRAYASDLRAYSRFIAGRDLCPLSEETVLAYADFLRSVTGAAPRTLRRRMTCLRGFYKDLVRQGRIGRSPFAGIELQLPRVNVLPRAMTRSDTARLAAAAWAACDPARRPREARRFPAAILLLIATGIRVGELVRLRPYDFDPEGGSLLVRGKGRKERRVFIVDPRLRRLLGGFTSCAPESLTLLGPNGAGWSTGTARRRLRTFARDAGIAVRVTPHMLRHTCAT